MASEIIVQTIKGPTSGANANKVIIPSGQTLDASNGFVAPAGSVIQHLSVSDNTDTRNTTATFTDTNLSLNITPKFSNSKISITGHLGLGADTTTNQGLGVRLLLDGTQLTNWSGISSNSHKYIIFYHDSGHTRDFYGQMPFHIFNTGALTAGTSYNFKIQFRSWISSNGHASVNSSGYTNSVMTIEEIAQ
jgi:hypothetical protein